MKHNLDKCYTPISEVAAYAMFIWDNSYDGLPEIDWI